MTTSSPWAAQASVAGLLLLGAWSGPDPAAARGQQSEATAREPHVFYEHFSFDSPDASDAAFELAREYRERLQAASDDHVPMMYSSPIGGTVELHVLAESPTVMAMRDAFQASVSSAECVESWTELAKSAASYGDTVWVPIELEHRPESVRGRTIVLRTFRAKGHERYAARAAAVALGNYINREHPSVDARLYEQNIGELGTYHWLYHVRDYEVWLAVERELAADERYRKLFSALYSRCREGTETRLLFPQS